MAGLPGSIQSLMPAGPDEQVRRMRDLERRMDEMGPSVARSFKPVLDDLAAQDATLTAQQEDLTAAQETLATTVSGLATAQETLEAQQETLATAVAGIAALVGAQIEVGAFNHSETGFDPVAGAWATVSSVTLTVPDGFTQAVVTAVAYVAIRNTTPSTSTQIHCSALVAGVLGPVDDERSDPGVRSTTLATRSTRVTGLTGGGTFVVAAGAYAGADFAADAVNVATISGTVLWLR